MRREILVPLAILLALPLSGCILEDTRHTLFIAPDGSVTWRVMRDLIRSDKDDPAERLDEEQGVLGEIDTGEEGWGETLAELGAAHTSVELLRAERPYTVLVQARFAGLELLGQRLLEEVEQPGEFEYREDGSLRELTFTLHPQPGDEREGDERAAEEPQDELGLVLTQGRFIDAQGFRLSVDDVVATPLTPPADAPEILRYSLLWDLEG